MFLQLALFLAGLPGFSEAINCYKCTGYKSNNTCVEKYRQAQAVEGQFMCRVFERNGVVVSQGVVGLNICGPGYKKLLPGIRLIDPSGPQSVPINPASRIQWCNI